MTFIKRSSSLLLLSAAFLTGCNMVVMSPSGDIARQQANLITVSTLLMLLIIVPVILMTLFFAWRYRASNKQATYEPDWDHSTKLEVLIWGAPIVIIIALATITWIATHKLDPYRPLERLDAQRPLPSDVKPLEVQVVALDWKWLFIYPEQGIATVNEMAAPVDRPINFKLTSSSNMNSFYVPALAGMIYTMPGMQTKLHAVINKPGDFEGFSANYSGAGFSHMRFTFRAVSEEGFAQWVDAAKQAGGELNRAKYLELEKPSERVPVQRFAAVEPNLFDVVRNRCVESDRMCMHEMMAIDAKGGMGLAGFDVVNKYAQGTGTTKTLERRYVSAQACTTTDAERFSVVQ